MKTKDMSIFSAAVLLVLSQSTHASETPPTYMPGPESDDSCQPVSANLPTTDTALVNTTFQDAPLFSCGKRYKLIGQSDGNLVIYKITPSGESPIWASNTNNGPGSYNFIFQDDGNLVVYNSNKAIWASNSNGKGGNRLVMQDDGNLVIYAPSPYGALWTSNSGQPDILFDPQRPPRVLDTPCKPVSAPNFPSDTALVNRTFQDAPLTSCNGQYKLIGQSDGNLVIYKITPSGESPIWASNTNKGPGSYNFIFQDDGNLVIYNSNKAIWASNSNGKGGNGLVMQNDGNLVIYAPSGPVWASNSVQSDVPNFSGF